ncbi:hypothetical protein HYV64_01050 [Candidatus Shapirobacteria bacterium]|nr:hypothetical protein [Candidatus Shapirobacteria bacterium]
MSSPISYHLLTKNISNYLSTKVPATDISDYILSSPLEVEKMINELDICINSFNKFRILPKFPHKEYYQNALELDKVFHRDLPKFKSTFQKLKAI